MADTTVALLLRIRSKDGKRIYATLAYTANGKIKRLTALVEGKSEYHPKGVYALHFRDDGRLIYKQVGADPSAAQAASIRQEIILKSKALGLSLQPDLARPTPEATPPTSKRSLQGAAAKAGRLPAPSFSCSSRSPLCESKPGFEDR